MEKTEITENLKEWWSSSFKGNVPIYHPSDLDRFAKFVKLTYDKQNIFNSSDLYEFLHGQLENGKLKKDQKSEIDLAIALYEFGVNNLCKLFKP